MSGLILPRPRWYDWRPMLSGHLQLVSGHLSKTSGDHLAYCDGCGCTENPAPACNEYYDDGGSILKTQKVASVEIAGVLNQALSNCDNCTFLNDTFLFTMCAAERSEGMQVICDRVGGGWVQTCAWITGEYTSFTSGSNRVARLTVSIRSSNQPSANGADPRPTAGSCTSGAGGGTPEDSRTWVFEQTVPLIDAKRYSGCDPSCTDEIAETFETYPEITSLSLVSTTDSAAFYKYGCDISSSTCTVTLV